MNIEQTILGTMLLEPNTIDLVLGSVNSEMFYFNENKLIFETILTCKKNNFKIDIQTISSELRKRKLLDAVGGAYYISSLTDRIGSASNIDTHVKILIQDYIRRQMYVVFNQSLKDLEDGQNDIFEIYGANQTRLEKLFDVNKNEIKKIGDIISQRISQIEKQKDKPMLGVSTGHAELNSITSGWQGGDFIILAGRPSMGKTAISLHFAKEPVLKNNENCLYFSLEMSADRLSDRIISLETNINSELFRINKMNQSERIAVYEVSDKYANAQLYINDESGMTIEQIASIAITLDRKLKSKNKKGLGFIIIDYLQLIKFSLKDTKNSNEQIGHISKGIKALAKKLNIPVIALSQLNRDVEKRGLKYPVLSDLRDSGTLEQDADIIIFLYRGEYYGILEDAEGNSTVDIILGILAKHRNGGIGTFNFYKNKTWSYISDRPYQMYESENMPSF